MIHISSLSVLVVVVALLAAYTPYVLSFPSPVDDDANRSFSSSSAGSSPPEDAYDLSEELLGYEPGLGEAATDRDYGDMERFYPTYWPARVAARDELCSMCLAVMSRQDVLGLDEAELDGLAGSMLRPGEAEVFETVRAELVSRFSFEKLFFIR